MTLELDTGHEISEGDALVLLEPSQQLGEQFADDQNGPPEGVSPLPEETELTVTGISTYPDGVHVEIKYDSKSGEIMKFALENLLEDEHIEIQEE